MSVRQHVALVVDLVGVDANDARQLVDELTGGIRSGCADLGGAASIGEPELVDDGVLRVSAVVGTARAEPADILRSVIDAAGRSAAVEPSGWGPTAIEPPGTGTLIAPWCSSDRPEQGILRMELQAIDLAGGPGNG